MKLAMMRRIPHHTSGEAKPLTPVQDHALPGSATSVAPRFKRNSDTSTHATLRASCSQGSPKPVGRFCIRFSSAPSSSRKGIDFTVAASLCRGVNVRYHPYGGTARWLQRLSEPISIRKPLQNRIVTRRTEIFDETAKDRIE